MLRKFVTAIFILVNFLLETSVFSHFRMAGVVPQLTLILTCAFGFMRGEKEGMVIGFFCGLLQDICFGTFLGFYALLYLYVGYLNGKFSRIFYPEDIKLPLVLILLSNLTYDLLCYCLLFLLRGKLDFPYYFTGVILPEMLYTILATVIVYPAVLLLNGLLEAHEKRREQKFV